ncbi:hypothetical protein D3M96_05295 [Alcaligenes aquatilis]|uniref:Uncharacterized protein n=1 Tax=Alcaligenes aquatilis TaxID=323284 RepID=A0A3G2HSI2_9BURK|nr:hypothetical protein D3M96_05295 [Alcaligenes aquatilis]
MPITGCWLLVAGCWLSIVDRLNQVKSTSSLNAEPVTAWHPYRLNKNLPPQLSAISKSELAGGTDTTQDHCHSQNRSQHRIATPINKKHPNHWT